MLHPKRARRSALLTNGPAPDPKRNDPSIQTQCSPPESREFYLIYRLIWAHPLISIRPLEIGLLQEAVIDENF